MNLDQSIAASALMQKGITRTVEAGGPGSGRKPGNGLEKTHQWSESKRTGEHLLKSKGGPTGHSAGTYGAVSQEWLGPNKGKYKAETFGNAKGTTYHPSIEEAKDAAEKRFVAAKKF